MSRRESFFADWRNTLIVAILFVLAFVFYGSTLGNGLVHDDEAQITDNPYIKSVRYLPRAFTGCIWESATGGCEGTAYYRPMQNLSYLLTYAVSPSPKAFHFVNVLYFAAGIGLAFALVLLLTGNRFVAFIAALVMLAHPINSEVVNWVAAVPELLYAVFGMATIICFVHFRRGADGKRYEYLAYAFYALAVLSKEPAILLPAILLFLDMRMFSIPFKRLLTWNEAKRYAMFGAIAIGYFVTRMTVLGQGGGVLRTGFYGTFSLVERVYAFITLFAQYLGKLFYPNPLLFFYPFDKQTHFVSTQFVISLAVVVVFLGALYLLYRKRNDMAALALGWIVLFLLLPMVFSDKIGENVFAERYLYASSIGFGIFIGLVFYKVWKRGVMQKMVIGVALAALLGVSWNGVHARNEIWKDNETLFADTFAKNPIAPALRYNLASEHLRQGKMVQAKEEYLHLIAIAPTWVEIDKAYNNLGEIERREGNADKAMAYYEQAIVASKGMKPDYYNNLGGMYFEQGKILKSLVALCNAVELSGDKGTAAENMKQVIGTVNAAKERNYPAVYGDILLGDTFKKTDVAMMAYQGKSCADGGCTYMFSRLPESADAKKRPIFLTVLLAAYSPTDGSPIDARDAGIDQTTGNVAVRLSAEYKTRPAVFAFPMCDGTYTELLAE